MKTRLSWILMFIFICQGDCDFDCRREGMSCNGGSCNLDSGLCSECYSTSPPRQGFDCGLVTEFVDKGSCDNVTCENGGTCYEEDHVTSCYCHEEYYGETCLHRRYDALSTNEKMLININPLPGFVGLIYISGHREEPSCVLLPVPSPPESADEIPDHWMGYYGEFPNINSQCGNAWTNTTTKMRRITIQYKVNYLTGLDLQLTLTTTLDMNGVEINDASFSVSADALLLNQEIITSTFNPVTMATTTKDGALLPDTAVAVGVVLIFTFSVPENDFAALRLETVIANNSQVGDAADTIKLIKEGCIDNSVLNVIEEPPGPADRGVRSTIKFKLRTFKFSSSDVLSLTFIVKVCIVDSDCEQPTCPASNRNRRSLDEDETVLNKLIKVKDPQIPDDLEEAKSSRDDLQSRVFTVTVISEGVILAVFTVILLFLIGRLCRKKGKSQHTQTDNTVIYGYYMLR